MVRYGFVLVVASTSLIACGSDAKEAADAAPPDANLADAMPDAMPLPDAMPPADLSCLGNASPNTADDPVVLTANAFSIGLGGATPIANVAIDVLLESDPTGTAIASGTTDANGDAPISVATGATPLDVFVRATPADTYLTDETFFPDIVAANTPAPAVLLEPSTLNLLGSASNQDQLEENGFGVVIMLDCSGAPIFGATLTVPTGAIVYAGDNGLPDTNLTASSTAGTAFVFNIEPGEALVFDAEVDGQSLRDNTARSVAGQLVSIGIQP